MMLSNRIGLLLFLIVQLHASAVLSETFDPFQVPAAEFHRTVKKIALWPFRLPPATPDIEGIRSKLDEIVFEALRRHGFEVVSSSEVAARWETLSTSVSGVVDPVTGKSDAGKLERMRQLLTQELALEQGVDAFLSPAVSVGSLRVWAQRIPVAESGRRIAHTYWMAGREPATWHGERIRSLWVNRPIQVLGLRLGFQIFDASEIGLFNASYPIKWTRLYLNGTYEDRADSPLLEHRERISEIVELLVEPMAKPRARSR